jgi:hypothetical protein
MVEVILALLLTSVTVEHPREYFLGIRWRPFALPIRRTALLPGATARYGPYIFAHSPDGKVVISDGGEIVVEANPTASLSISYGGYRLHRKLANLLDLEPIAEPVDLEPPTEEVRKVLEEMQVEWGRVRLAFSPNDSRQSYATEQIEKCKAAAAMLSRKDPK